MENIKIENEFEVYSDGYIKLHSIDQEYRCPNCNIVIARRHKRTVVLPKPKTIMIRNDNVLIICKSCNHPLSLKKTYDFGKYEGLVIESVDRSN